MRDIKVTFEDGNTIVTGINGNRTEVRDYYVGKAFQFGDTEEHPKDKMVKATKVEFLDENDTLHIEANVDLNGFDGFDDPNDPNSILNIKNLLSGMVLHAIQVKDEFLQKQPRIADTSRFKRLLREISVARLIVEKLQVQFVKEQTCSTSSPKSTTKD